MSSDSKTSDRSSGGSTGGMRGSFKVGSVLVSYPFTGATGGRSTDPQPMRLLLSADYLTLQKETGLIASAMKGVEPNDNQFNANGSSIQLITSNDETQSDRNRDTSQASSSELRVVKLTRDKAGFGLSIKGGAEHRLPILISALTKNGPADRCGQLFIGDAIVKVNDVNLARSRHDEAIRILKNSGFEVTLTVKHYKTMTPFLRKSWRRTGNNELPDNNNGVPNGGSKAVRLKRATNGTNGRADNGHNGVESVAKTKEAAEAKWIDVIEVPLLSCYVTKYINDSDKTRTNGFEIRWHLVPEVLSSSSSPASPITDLRPSLSSAVVHCNDSNIFKEWGKHIEGFMSASSFARLKVLNKGRPGHRQVLFMGWVSQGIPNSKSEPRPCYRWSNKYLIIKGGDLFLYNFPPLNLLASGPGQGRDEAEEEKGVRFRDQPLVVYKAYQSVMRCLTSRERADERENCVLLMSSEGPNALGVKHSVANVSYLCLETSHDINLLKSAWYRATYYSVTLLGSATFSVKWQSLAGSLTLDWKSGFAFYSPLEKEYKWTFRFSQLKTSSDDGKDRLWLTFMTEPGLRETSGNNRLKRCSSTETKELICSNLQNLLYSMHAFLSAKVASVDPQFLAQA